MPLESSSLGRVAALDELLVCIIRAVKNAKGMPVINENNLIATCDHLENLTQQAMFQIDNLRKENGWQLKVR